MPAKGKKLNDLLETLAIAIERKELLTLEERSFLATEARKAIETTTRIRDAIRCTKAKIREVLYAPDSCVLCGQHHNGAIEYFAKHLAYEGQFHGNFAHHDKTIEEQAADLNICACGHASGAHRKDSLDNLLDCEGCTCDHFHYQAELEQSGTIELQEADAI